MIKYMDKILILLMVGSAALSLYFVMTQNILYAA